MQTTRLLAMATCVVVIGGAGALAAEEMSVQVKTTQVRDRGSYLGKTKYMLHYGDRVMVLQKGAAWYKIRPVEVPTLKLEPNEEKKQPDLTGFLNKSALSTKRIVLKGDQDAQVMASSENVILAGKGFSEDVERSYKSEHPNLAAAFAALDDIEMNPLFVPTMEEVSDFRAEGGLEGGDM